jgi:hypothetical protein
MIVSSTPFMRLTMFGLQWKALSDARAISAAQALREGGVSANLEGIRIAQPPACSNTTD